jgi:uncharacterized integral membrane protein (TIGR00697 family)
VVFIGFLVAIVLSIWLATPRIAIASGSAFLFGQLLDISIFQRFRNRYWLIPPLSASLFGSLLDTAIFFTLAFAPALAGLDTIWGMEDSSLGFGAPFLGVGPEVPLWVSLASGDFAVKFLAALLLLAPYRALMGPVGQRPVTRAG